MKKHNNKYQNHSRINDDAEMPEVDACQQAKRKGHGDQRQANRRAKQLRQDVEFNAAIKETFHAS